MPIWLRTIGSIAAAFCVLYGSIAMTMGATHEYGYAISGLSSLFVSSLSLVAFYALLKWAELYFKIQLLERPGEYRKKLSNRDH